MSEHLAAEPLTKKDFTSDQMVRWCPGCGDYAILAAIQKVMPALEIPKEKFAFISGIGCAARFPYYMNTYGFHTIHGRAPAFATGLKVANPQLSVWVITGDGDSMAIGGNHFIHALRRNIDVNVLLFNNEIYGLTKGQYSPTSQAGTITKSTPYGSVDTPFSAGELALGAKASFYARTIDTNPKLMGQHFLQAAAHKGTSLVEILQNCVIFNDKVHGSITNKETAADNQLHLEHGKPMIFGKEKNSLHLEVVTIGENGITEADILVHDAHGIDNTLHNMLVKMRFPEFPVALGVIRQVEAPIYDKILLEAEEKIKPIANITSMDQLLASGNTWEIE